MNIFLTTIFLVAWLNNLNGRTHHWDDIFWWGVVILLCGIYFSLEDFNQLTNNERR